MNVGQVARELKRELANPRTLCFALGLGVDPRDRQWQSAGLTVRCPRHGGVSCSVTRGADGTVRVHCFGCDFAGDALDLVAAAHGLGARRDFRELLRVATGIARRWDLTHALDASTCTDASREAPPSRTTVRHYPSVQEVAAFWHACIPCSLDPEVSELVTRRGLSPGLLDDLGLGRTLPQTATRLPRWASFRGQRSRRAPWTETGHRFILPVYDPLGRVRSVRAWCVRDQGDPKRLPPAGHCARNLVLACSIGARLLACGCVPEGDRQPVRIIIAEGEPDFLTWATRYSDACADAPAVFGLVSGAWSDELAARFPRDARVVVRTHHDPAGDAYAEAVWRSLRGRCHVLRSKSSS